MSIASRIQEIETHIGDVYDTINYSYDTTGINKNIINIPKYLKKGYIDIINNGIDTLYNNFPKVSGIGSNLSLTPTYETPMKLNEIQGSTLQDGVPTPDTPVEIQSVTGLQNIEVCGKNLCFNITKPSNANLRFFINKSISKTFTISFTTNEALNGNSLYLEVDGTDYGNIGGITAGANTKAEKTYTLSDTNYQAIQDGTNIDLLLYKNGANFNIPNDGMVENNSTATSYEPYKGNTYEVNLGKNLFQNQATDTTSNGITYTIDDKGGITANDTATALSYILPQTQQQSPLYEAGTYTFSLLNDMTNKGYVRFEFYKEDKTTRFTRDDVNSGSTTITLSEKGYLRVSYIINNGVTVNNFYNMIQVEKGSTASEVSPYFTPIELNKIGDYQDSIKKSTGKNLITTYNYASSGYINYNYDNSKIGKTMTYSFIPNFSTTNASLYIRANTSISSYKVGTIATITSGTKVSVTFTLTDEQYNTIKNTTGGYIQVYKSGVSMDENSISNPMLEINSQSTSYEPYGKVWYVENNIGKVVLNGNEAWGYDSNSLFFVSSNAISNYSRSNNIPYCDYYKGVSNVNGGGNINNNEIAFNNNVSNNRLYVKNTNITSASDFKTWLSTHNTEVLYALATPEYTEITNTELIENLETLYTAKSQEGTTNISITSEDLEMILNVSALKGDA